jgi:hypothetical protein
MEGSKQFQNECIINPNLKCLNKDVSLPQSNNPLGLFIKEKTIVCSMSDAPIVRTKMRELHALVATADMCFRHHYPIMLKPDDFLLPIMQSFTAARPTLEAGVQKIQIKLRIDDFMEENANYGPLVAEFHAQIKAHVGPEKSSVFEPLAMSTTGPYQRLAYSVALMDMYQNQFSYSTFSMCGIPKVTLLGTQQDWKNLHLKVQQLLETHPCTVQEWKVELLGILQEIATTGAGNADFWRNFFKFQEASGGDIVTGWINAFFPSIRNYSNTISVGKKLNEIKKRRHYDSYPLSVCCAPATHENYVTGEKYDTTFYAGQVGVGQKAADNGYALFPVWGFAIGTTKK